MDKNFIDLVVNRYLKTHITEAKNNPDVFLNKVSMLINIKGTLDKYSNEEQLKPVFNLFSELLTKYIDEVDTLNNKVKTLESSNKVLLNQLDKELQAKHALLERVESLTQALQEPYVKFNPKNAFDHNIITLLTK